MKRVQFISLFATGALLLAVGSACQNDTAEDTQPAEQADAPAPATQAPAPTTESTGFLDPNQASREQLLAVPGFDAALADAVVAGRPYQNNLQVERVLSPRLSEAQRDSVYTRLWIPLDLNSASGEEIMLIPGVGPRMRGEFLEYRPYEGMAEFRREIGKYVDENEVGRLERYVTIR